MYKSYADIWATVPNFPRYEVNRLGTVRVVNTGHVLKPILRRSKTLYVRLYQTPRKPVEKTLASVVWAAFFGRWPDRGTYVCHADGDLNNNNLDNLFLGTRGDVRKTQRRRDDIIWSQFLEEGGLTNG